MVGHRKKNTFIDIKEKFVQKMKAWSVRNLSISGKEIFLKAILQAIPSYSMKCFKLPSSFRRELEALMSQFWWRNLKTGK